MASNEFKVNDQVVYPAHGVGTLIAREKRIVGGHDVELLVINFEKEKMILRLPVSKAKNAGLRKLSTKDSIKEALDSLTIRTRPKRTMWSRRAQEYETKINSGLPTHIAEVLRDLYRRNSESEQSYSERQIYQVAMDRFAREVAAVEKIDETKAIEKVEKHLSAA